MSIPGDLILDRFFDNFEFKITSIETLNCPKTEKIYNLKIDRYSTQYQLIPTNINDLKTEIYEIADIGFGGIIIKDTFTVVCLLVGISLLTKSIISFI